MDFTRKRGFWAAVKRRMAVLAMLGVWGMASWTGCGGSSSNPTTPNPAPPVNLTGVYNGTLTFKRSQGGGCVGATINKLKFTTPIRLEVHHNGSFIDMTMTLPNLVGTSTLTFSGSYSNGSYQLNLTGGSGTTFLFFCLSGAGRLVVITGGTLSGTGTHAQLTGDYVSNWLTPEGVATVTAHFSVNR